MKRKPYYFDWHNLRFEPIRRDLRWWLVRTLVVLSAASLIGILLVFLTFNYLDSPKEKRMKRNLEAAELQLQEMQKQLTQYETMLNALNERDNNIYRVIFEAPITPQKKQLDQLHSNLNWWQNPSELLDQTQHQLDIIGRQLYAQSKSYDEICEYIQDQDQMLFAIPSVPPLSNRDTLVQIASGYGYRIHPIHKTKRMHWGLDFQAPMGYPVHVVGDGRVKDTPQLKKGYGNHIIIDHGYGYQTLYAHLSEINVRRGQRVKRGDVIGKIGSSGTSTAPHLHYEVMKNTKKIDPINFFFQDITPDEYDRMLEAASRHNQSFD